MINTDLANLADTMALRAGFSQPLSLAEMKSVAETLRSLAARVEAMESRPIPPTKRWPVIPGGVA